MSCLAKPQNHLLNLEIFERQELIEFPYKTDEKIKYLIILNNEKHTLSMVKQWRLNFQEFSKEMVIDFHREVSILCKLNHPSILQFLGYSLINFKKRDKPVIITEYTSKFTLFHLFAKDDGDIKLSLNDTQKLINIYGIASGMSYLHSHGIIHRNLILENIFLDEHLHPKIAGFNISKEIKSTTFLESRHDSKIKRNTDNLAPEVLIDYKYSKMSDVFEFSFIAYTIMMDKIPYCHQYNHFLHDYPKFDDKIPEVYQNLIKKCWSLNPNERLTFDEIIHELRTNPEFITDSINKEEYYNYIKYIEESQIEFNNDSYLPELDEFVKKKLHTFHKNEVNLELRGPLNSENNEFNLNNYIKKDKINSNSLFKAYEVCEKETKLQFTVRSYLKEIKDFARHEIINFCGEINIITKLNHPSIIKFIGYSPTDFYNNPYPTIITEYYGKDNLENYCKGYVDETEWDDTKKLINIYSIASGMSYLHSHNIIHCNLTPESIYLDKNFYPRIGGFTIAKVLGENSKIISDTIKGTPIYLAPETYLNKEYSKSSDVYAFGFIIYKIMTNEKIFKNLFSPSEIKQKVAIEGIRLELNNVPNIYRKLIERCWSSNPEERPTFDEIIHELKTNQEFLTDLVIKEDYFEYIEFLDEFNITFEPDKQINELEKILSSKLDTFHIIQPFADLKKMNELETNDLVFDYNFINMKRFYYKNEKNGYFYKMAKADGYFKRNTKFGEYNTSINEEENEEEEEEEDDDLIEYAIKSFAYSTKYFFRNGIVNFRREMKIISKLNHPSILKFIGYNPYGSDKKKPAIITEYASNGPLDEIIMKNYFNFYLDEPSKYIILYGIALGMSYLHSHGIIHRDLKAENIFLDEFYNPKITGFTISKEIGENSKVKSNKIKGTPIYLAPEIYISKEYSKSSDVYAFSFIMYELITGQKPFKEMISPSEIKQKVAIDGIRPELNNVPNIYRKLIERCWSSNPEERPTFDEIAHELKTNPEFIVASNEKQLDQLIEEEDFSILSQVFQDYFILFNKSKISFDPSKEIKEFENYTPSNLYHNFLLSKINIRPVYKTEAENILFDYDFIDIKKYDKQNLIYSSQRYNIYTIVNKETGLIYNAKRYNDEINNLMAQEEIDLIREINMGLEIDHPLFLKFIGYSPVDFKNKLRPIIVTENASNKSLDQVIKLEKSNHFILNDTKKLIIIYGIAVGMQYLHSLGIIHCQLHISSIFLDEFLFPKIGGIAHSIRISEVDLYQKFDVYTNIYDSPEVNKYHKYSPASDVYSFAMILYTLITNEEPFSDSDSSESDNDIYEYLYSFRPEFKHQIPNCYRKLIEKCWSQEPKDRPSFDEIVYHLKTNNDFITDKIDKEEYMNFIKYVETIQDKKYKSSNDIFALDDFITSQKFTFRKIDIDYKKIKESTRKKFSIYMGSINLDMYDKKQKIGSGGFGVVYKVFDKSTSIEYAAKISIYEIDQCSDDIIKNLSREIDIMSNLNHPAILKYIGYSPCNFKNKPKPVIFIEFAPNGSLHDILDLERRGLCSHDWDDTKKLINIYGIASALKYLHQQNILHRDLKPGNILLDELLYPKLADFGLAKNDYNTKEHKGSKKKQDKIKIMDSGFVGTYMHCSPEILEKHEYTYAGDVYAFGLIMYEIITNEIPFPTSNIYEFLRLINQNYRPEFKYPIPYCYKKLITKCWHKEPSSRPHFYKIVNELENNPLFITSNINKEEYFDYISQIKDNGKELFQNNLNKQENPKVKNSINLKINELEDEKENNFLYNNGFSDLSNFEKKEIISKYDFTKIYKLEDKKTTIIYSGQMSMININKLSNEDVSKLSFELKNISQLNHPLLLKFIGYSPVDFKYNPKPVIITEYASNGSLHDILEIERLNNSIHVLDDTKKLIIIYGIACAMSYLHSHEIIHCCLKPSTIYLDDILLPKIGDFGLSMKFYNHSNIVLQSISGLQGSPIYSAPEVLQFNKYSKSSDVYSFAFIVYEIATSEIPFNNINNFNQILNEIIVNKNRPQLTKNTISPKLRELINDCWNHDPNMRPTFDEIVVRLRNDQDFITNKIDKESYFKFIDYIDNKTNSYELIKEDENEINEDNKKHLSPINYRHTKDAENKDVETMESLFKKYSNENDTENIYKYFCMLIKTGNYMLPLEYTVKLFKLKYYKQAYRYFLLISENNNPIANYYIGIMKFKGLGCCENREESYKILKNLSDNGLERAGEFLYDHF